MKNEKEEEEEEGWAEEKRSKTQNKYKIANSMV